MISQIVMYTPYDKNPAAAEKIISLAKKYIASVPGTKLRVGKAISSDRSVNISNGKVIKTTTWESAKVQLEYMSHPNLIQYVREVLCGWRLEGDPDDASSAQVFIDSILNGSGQRKWERNASVPDSDVVWGGEVIILHEWE